MEDLPLKPESPSRYAVDFDYEFEAPKYFDFLVDNPASFNQPYEKTVICIDD